MSNAVRPSAARKETRKTKESRQAILEQGIRLTVADAVYEVRLGDVDAATERRFRRAYGAPVMGLMEEFSNAPGLDTFAGLIWLSRILKGEDVELDDVEFTYADAEAMDAETTGPEEAETDSPEA